MRSLFTPVNCGVQKPVAIACTVQKPAVATNNEVILQGVKKVPKPSCVHLLKDKASSKVDHTTWLVASTLVK